MQGQPTEGEPEDSIELKHVINPKPSAEGDQEQSEVDQRTEVEGVHPLRVK
jgi:hypothetical protein